MLPAPICAERRICRCSLAWRLSPPARRSWLTSSGVASESGPVPKDRFSSIRGPSWTNPLSRRLRPEGHRVSRKKEWLFRRLFRLVRLGTEVPPHRLPVEIGPSVPSLRGGLGLPSRSPIRYAPRHESLKAESAAPSLWITGISGTSYGHGPNLPGCPSVPPLLPRPCARIPHPVSYTHLRAPRD